jgi:Domain of unknown function (DUF3883)
MEHYRGKKESIFGGGNWANKQEVANFLPIEGRVYGYAQPVKEKITLSRIAPGSAVDRIDRVLVIFFASRRDGSGQVVVGWYRNATVYQHVPQLPSRIKKARNNLWHYFEAATAHACLLPLKARVHPIPRGPGATGYAMITYARDTKGRLRAAQWIERAVDFVRKYRGPNLLTEPDAEVRDKAATAAEEVLDLSHGQGFGITSAERRAIEEHAMIRAIRHYELEGYRVTRVGRPYDLHCVRSDDPAEELHVEVKGTQGLGGTIILTENEVRHARRNSQHMHLFVVHSIRLSTSRAGKVLVKGGQVELKENWSPMPASLTPIAYYCRLAQ